MDGWLMKTVEKKSSLTVRLYLPFKEYIIFSGYLPYKTDEVTIDKVNPSIIIRIDDTLKNLSPRDHVEVALTKDLSKLGSIHCQTLTIDVVYDPPDKTVLRDLTKSQKSEATEQFGKNIFNTIIQLQHRVVDFIRDESQQFWLGHLSEYEENYQSFLRACDAKWLDSTGVWRRLEVVRKETIRLDSPIRLNGITKEMWKDLSAYLRVDRKIDVYKTFLTNSRSSLSHRNYRVALIEAVTAFESFITHQLPKAISKRIGQGIITDKIIEKLSEKAGLRTSADVFLRMMDGVIECDASVIENSLAAINIRNNLIHGGQRTVKEAVAKKSLKSIQDIMIGVNKYIKDG